MSAVGEAVRAEHQGWVKSAILVAMKRSFWSAWRRRGAWATAASCFVCGLWLQGSGVGQGPAPILAAPASSKHGKKKAAKAEETGPKPSASIPVGALGFAPPSPYYLGDQITQASLDFLGEDSLLFTFRIPKLIERDPSQKEEAERNQRAIRAVVLSLPSGKVTAEATWLLHDFGAYLWMLNDQRFLLRDRNELKMGDKELKLTPDLRFRGPLKYVEIDPRQQYLLAETTEPATAETRRREQPSLYASNEAASTEGGGVSDAHERDSGMENLVRILRMGDHQVALLARIEANERAHLAMDGDGYYDAERKEGQRWLIGYEDFTGAFTPILPVQSSCHPRLDSVAPGYVLVSGCGSSGQRILSLLSRDKHHLWDAVIPPTLVWPLLAQAAAAPRIARVTLDVNHAIGTTAPLDSTDIRGQVVQVYDLANGKVVLTGPASPVLDGGGGFALSPSGRRFAVLNEGAIQIYELPPAPALPPLEMGKR